MPAKVTEPRPTQGVVTVVSGVPRSGTSLLMQMLEAGGMPLLVDSCRPADADNPRGYCEFAPVKRTAIDGAWVRDAVGKAVKVVHLLLPHLPATYRYRILFAQRDAREVLASQRVMLERFGRHGADLPPDRLATVLAAQARHALDWAGAQPHVRLAHVNHHDLIHHPSNEARRINALLGGSLDEAAMAAAVEPSLYRQRCHPVTTF